MSWRKKKKQMRNIKHKVTIAVGLMFAVVIGLIIFLCCRLFINKGDYYSIESRVDKVNSSEYFENTTYRNIGWLRVQGTKLDLPIIYSDDKNADFPVQLGSYVWSENNSDGFNSKMNITGHNIFNLSSQPKIKSDMFYRLEELMAFVYYDFAKDNEYIQLTIDGKDYLYKIFAAGFMDKSDTSFFSTSDNPTEKEINNELDIIKNNNLYKYDIDVNSKDKIISLSTCTRFFGREDQVEFYVYGRLLRDNEKINHYKVTKSDNYKKIEKILKGDENDK